MPSDREEEWFGGVFFLSSGYSEPSQGTNSPHLHGARVLRDRPGPAHPSSWPQQQSADKLRARKNRVHGGQQVDSSIYLHDVAKRSHAAIKLRRFSSAAATVAHGTALFGNCIFILRVVGEAKESGDHVAETKAIQLAVPLDGLSCSVRNNKKEHVTSPYVIHVG